MNDAELDAIVEDALALYTREPGAGLNAQILARIDATRSSPRWSWSYFVAAGLTLAGIVMAVVLWPRAVSVAPLQVRTAEPVPVARITQPPQRKRIRRRLPRRDSITPELRALVAFAQQSPDAARELSQPDKPLQIEAIDIRPLEIAGLKIGEIK